MEKEKNAKHKTLTEFFPGYFKHRVVRYNRLVRMFYAECLQSKLELGNC